MALLRSFRLPPVDSLKPGPAGCYPLNDTELSAFPFAYEDIKPYYGEVARRIGIGGEEDDLAQFFPHHEHLSAPVALDESSAILLTRYERRRKALTAKHEFVWGARAKLCLQEARKGEMDAATADAAYGAARTELSTPRR